MVHVSFWLCPSTMAVEGLVDGPWGLLENGGATVPLTNAEHDELSRLDRSDADLDVDLADLRARGQAV